MPSNVANKIEKSCKHLNAASTVFHIKDLNKLLKNQDLESGESETCKELLTTVGSRQEKSVNSQGHSKGKGKQKSGKTVASTNVLKVKVWFSRNDYVFYKLCLHQNYINFNICCGSKQIFFGFKIFNPV